MESWFYLYGAHDAQDIPTLVSRHRTNSTTPTTPTLWDQIPSFGTRFHHSAQLPAVYWWVSRVSDETPSRLSASPSDETPHNRSLAIDMGIGAPEKQVTYHSESGDGSALNLVPHSGPVPHSILLCTQFGAVLEPVPHSGPGSALRSSIALMPGSTPTQHDQVTGRHVRPKVEKPPRN